MKEYKLRQQLFYKLFGSQDLGDRLEKEVIVEEFEESLIIKRAEEYFTVQTSTLYYPGKSYAVALIYALLLEKEFGEDIYVSLDDEDLLWDDPYFKPYSVAKNIYDALLKKIPRDFYHKKESYTENLSMTIDYFYQEFLLSDETSLFFKPKNP